MVYLFVDDIWLMVKKYLIDYSLIKYKKWKERQHILLKKIIPIIPSNVCLWKRLNQLLVINFKENHGFIFNNVINPVWRNDNLQIKCMTSDLILDDGFIYKRYYHVLFYNINDIHRFYL
jgi:hypothetical protein